LKNDICNKYQCRRRFLKKNKKTEKRKKQQIEKNGKAGKTGKKAGKREILKVDFFIFLQKFLFLPRGNFFLIF
jgi:hypothetical protein